MSYRQAILAALVVNVVLIDIASALWIEKTDDNSWEAIWFYALMFSQMGPMGTWMVWGRISWVIRLTLPLGAALAWNYALKNRFYASDEDDWFLLSFGTMLLSGGEVLLLRLRGWNVDTPLHPAPEHHQHPHDERLQFSIKQAIGVTTVTAILLGILRLMTIDWDYLFASEYLTILSVLSLTAVLTIWNTLALRGLWFRIPVSLAMVAGLAYVFSLCFGEWLEFWLSLMLVEATFCILILLVLRAAGYRLVRTKRHTTPPIVVADGR